MTHRIYETFAKEMSPEVKDYQNCDALRSKGLTIDHVIILIAIIALSITIINTYATVGFP